MRLPSGYSLERSDPDVLDLRCPHGTAIARFSARGATAEAIEQEARMHYRARETGPREVRRLQGLSRRQRDKRVIGHSCEISLASYLQPPLAGPKPIVAPEVAWFCVSSLKLTSIT